VGGRAGLAVLLVGLMARASAAAPDALEAALRLQRDGKQAEALDALRILEPTLRASKDRAALARALAAAGDASIALGDYESAIRVAREAFDLHQQLGQNTEAAWDLNAVGLANLYLGRYDDALASYQRALSLDRAGGDGDGEITRLNNIGNVHYMRGRYADALSLYQDALAGVDARTTGRSRARLRKMTLSNLAALFQRLGANERAVELYEQLRGGGAMHPSEEAQLLINEGALFRRLGDPVKALEAYGRAQELFAGARHRDGEIGAWRNIGIARALDFGDERRALDAFGEALRLSRESSNRRGEVQALLYRGETLRRGGRLAEAAVQLQTAHAGAAAAGLVEEQWKALYSIGRVFEEEGRIGDARQSFERAIAGFESVRSDIRDVSLRSEFLADKRDVYDALIALRLSERETAFREVFELVERSRARTWQDRLQPGPTSLADVQARIGPDALLLEYWTGATTSALLWLSSSASGIVRGTYGRDEAGTLQQLTGTISGGGDDWRVPSAAAGRLLLSGLPDLRGITRVHVVADGSLHFVPFEILALPDTGDLLIERVEVSYLPSAALLVRSGAGPDRGWKWPWQRELLAFGAPAPGSGDLIGEEGALSRLPYAEEEIRGIAALLPGRAEIRLGRDAQKRFLDDRVRDVPLLHFSTHAVADTRDPDRSRILLAPASAGASDYLFLREIYDLDLSGVQLVTISACSTERGAVIRGEGVEGFSRALLAAGAGSAVTTMWDVADRASAEFMKQFYFALARGQSQAAALRWAKLQFLRSDLAWSHPRYWAGYVLTGRGTQRLPRVVPWGAVVGVPMLIVVAAAAAVYGRRGRVRI
jgi:tetratricopeptide (TPR) repeat protein